MKIKLLFLFLLFSYVGFSQGIPQLKVEKAEKEITLEKLCVSTEIIGNIATTTYEMDFYNPNNHVMEGELSFPLGENQNVVRFALDINNNLREAVVVKKEKARVAFEATTRQRIDPALLEKVEGNNYKARVYPIPSKGYKKVVLAFEEELTLTENAHQLRYNFDFTNSLEHFSLSIIALNQKTASISNSSFLKNTKFKTEKGALKLDFRKKNFSPNGTITIDFPLENTSEKLITFEEYFYFYKYLKPEKRKRKLPSKIDLFWDTSLSMEKRNLKKELAILEDYFSLNKNVKITVFNFSNRIKQEKTFKIKNGNWKDLKSYLENTKYDGATSYQAIKNPLLNAPHSFLFSDGMKNFGTISENIEKPLFIFNSLQKANHFYLKELCLNSGGNYINLNRISEKEALDLLENETFNFIGFKKEKNSELEIYPNSRAVVTNDFSIVGKDFMNDETLELYFGFGNKKTKTIKVLLNDSKTQSAKIPKFWATKKIASLSKNKKENEEEIVKVSKEYQVISDFTSMIVLDRVEDYVEHEIVPPADLQDKYYTLLQEKRRREKELAIDNDSNTDIYLDDLKDFAAWNKRDYVQEEVERKKKTPLTNALQGKVSGVETIEEEEVEMMESSSPPAPETIEIVENEEELMYQEEVEANADWGDEEMDADYAFDDGSRHDSKGKKSNSRKSSKLKAWDSNMKYVKELKKIKLTDIAYQRYLEMRPDYKNMPTFYFDVADFFIQRNTPHLALQIISNVAEMDVDNFELLRALAYKLEATKNYQEAVFVYEKILELRPEDLQSYRDLALAYDQIGEHQKAIELLYAIVNGSLYEKDSERRFRGIEEIVFIEMNRILHKYPKKVDTDFIDSKYIENLSMDFRIVIDWNHNNTDIDLWVTDPNKEKCYYNHKKTKINGRISDDMTQGFGPESFTLKRKKEGDYLGQIKYFGDTKQKISGPTILKATIFENYGTENETKEIKVYRLDKKEDVLTFFEAYLK
ncbi:VIT domain-containing protein [Aureivirga sp. CE67]|uniref:VIT domain-containing protein n=1 Tax=Aureivirga sp. CE67 TaxID=1788983 RepID=UPI0018CB5FFD|nr:VIT domain-containing protein [Aureivirga sp. CE67]